MLSNDYEIGARLASGEITTFRAVSRGSGQTVLFHSLPARGERLEYWRERIREFEMRFTISPILGMLENQGQHFVVTWEIADFPGFPAWLSSVPPGSFHREVSEQPLPHTPSGSVNDVQDFFEPRVNATELFKPAASPVKKKRDYVPPEPPGPSPYTKIVRPSAPPAPSVNTPAVSLPVPVLPSLGYQPPAPDQLLAQAVEKAVLEGQVKLWRILAFASSGLAAILLIVLLVISFQRI